jgi:hypothetical protein
MDKQVVDQIVDPVAIKIIHKSRLFDEAKKKASIKKKAKVTTKVLKKSIPTDVAKPESNTKLCLRCMVILCIHASSKTSFASGKILLITLAHSFAISICSNCVPFAPLNSI